MKHEPEILLRLEQFLSAISEVSYRFGLAVDENGIIYRMEPEDYERRYSANTNDRLVFGA